MRLTIIIFLFFPSGIFAQTDFSSIDRKVRDIPFSDTKTLAGKLSSMGKTDREKVRAIFRWITDHIDYNVKIFNRNNISPGLFYEEPDDSSASLPSLNERVSAKVLNKRIAFCDGYSRLFKTLCDFSGIKSEIITGYARTNFNRSGRFNVNHTWNAVFLDSSWHLLDVTWASGFISYGQYIRQYNDYYYLTPPEQFIRDHYPEDTRWALMNDPPFYREYNQSPFRYFGFIKAGINSYLPAKGVIDVAVGDTILFELTTTKEIKNFYVSDVDSIDSILMPAIPAFEIKNDKFSFKYPITSSTAEWLYVYCNDELTLRYKLNAKKEVQGKMINNFNMHQ